MYAPTSFDCLLKENATLIPGIYSGHKSVPSPNLRVIGQFGKPVNRWRTNCAFETSDFVHLKWKSSHAGPSKCGHSTHKSPRLNILSSLQPLCLLRSISQTNCLKLHDIHDTCLCNQNVARVCRKKSDSWINVLCVWSNCSTISSTSILRKTWKKIERRISTKAWQSDLLFANISIWKQARYSTEGPVCK